jgi:hypothetical protein
VFLDAGRELPVGLNGLLDRSSVGAWPCGHADHDERDMIIIGTDCAQSVKLVGLNI